MASPPDPSALAAEFPLPAPATQQIARLLEALAAEPDPHTTVSDPSRAIDVHVRDALVALELDSVRSASRIADLGAGAGFPGLPLAIALPRARVDLIESAKRKCAVIDRLAAAADITNAVAVHARAEAWAAGAGAGTYDVVTARAVAPLGVLAEYAAPLLRIGGQLVAWKGRPDESELADAEFATAQLGLERHEVRPVHPFQHTEGLSLYVYSKVGETPSRYPRRPGMARKRPLVAEN